jgi:phosphoribosylglycinamide formyltransferase-1
MTGNTSNHGALQRRAPDGGNPRKIPIAVLVSGRGSNLQALIDACAAPDFPARIVLVLSNVAGADALARAERAGIPTAVLDHKGFASRQAFDAAMRERIDATGATLVCLAGFLRLLSPEFVTHYAGRLINIHPSLLPAFPGLHTHERAVAAGVRFSGCTVHFVVPEVDAGPIIVQAAVPVHPGDTADQLAARVLEAEHRLYPQAVRWFAEGRLTIEGQRVQVAATRAAPIAVSNPPIDGLTGG